MPHEMPKIPVGKTTPEGEAELKIKPETLDFGAPELTREKAMEFLGEGNKGFFKKMSDGAKKIANQAYEGLYKVPGVNKIAGKMEIAYNQFWADRHEEKAVNFKTEMGNLDIAMEANDEIKKEIEGLVDELRKEGIPGAEKLGLKIKELDKRRVDMQNKKDKFQSKLEARRNKMTGYINERDSIADRLIKGYEEKLKPIEEHLSDLSEQRDRHDFKTSIAEAIYKKKEAELNKLEEKKRKLEGDLRASGMSEGEVKKFVKVLADRIDEGRERVNVARLKRDGARAVLNEKIEEQDERANPHRDNREWFVRIKNQRPLEISSPKRTKERAFRGRESAMANPREGVAIEEGHDKSTTFFILVSRWNNFLARKYSGENISNEVVDLPVFLKDVGASAENITIDLDDFREVLYSYYAYRKMPKEKLRESADEFLEQIKGEL